MKPKKGTGNKNEDQPPVRVSKEERNKKTPSGQGASGAADSTGGSREGNVGHQVSEEGGQGDRQV